jgi:hypothetical protein
MCALWDDPPFVRDPSENIPEGMFRVSELDTWDHDEWGRGDFKSLEEAVQRARTLRAKDGSKVYRVWSDQRQVVYTAK